MSLQATSSAAGADHRLLALSNDAREGGRPKARDVPLEVSHVDAEAVLIDCQDFLVDGPGGEEIGIVDAVEREGPGDTVSALLVVAGWFGRKHLRVDRHEVEAVLPDERRIVVREAHPVQRDSEGA